jgi:hypothetical protein
MLVAELHDIVASRTVPRMFKDICDFDFGKIQSWKLPFTAIRAVHTYIIHIKIAERALP